MTDADVWHHGPLDKRERNWEIWRHHMNGKTFVSIAADFGISAARARQITMNRERKVKRALKRRLFLGPDANFRDEILDVEFVFGYEQDVPKGVKSQLLKLPGDDGGDGDEGIHWWVKQVVG